MLPPRPSLPDRRYSDRPELAAPPPVFYDRAESDPPISEWAEPVELDADTAKALLRHEMARDTYRPRC